MSAYKPSSRRPIADIFRRTAHLAVRLCVRFDVNPDTISYSSIVASAMAGLCIWKAGAYPALLWIGPLFCYLRLWLNMLDGMVALAAGKASLHGEIVNEFPDRISDVLIFAGVAHSGLVYLPLGYWAAIMALLTAYIGIFGQAIGVQREFSGWMSKQWRMVALHLGAWIMAWQGGAILNGTLLLIIAGCVQTIGVRLMRILDSLRRKKS